MRRGAVVAQVALVLVVIAAPGAAASEASPQEVRALAERALEDPAALEELRRVDSVGGRPVDHAAALEGASGAELERRLRSLADAPEGGVAGDEAGPSVDPTLARREAQEVLGQNKFENRDIPRPFKGVLDAIGGALRRVGDWLYALADGITGGNPLWLLWALVAGAAALGVYVAGRLIKNRARRARAEEAAHAVDERLDADELESQAETAEREGRLEDAIRLRFRAGLVRLSRAHVIPPRPSLTSGDVARYLRSRSFEEVAATFDEVVYGRRTPHPDDVAKSRAGWRSVIEEARASKQKTAAP